MSEVEDVKPRTEAPLAEAAIRQRHGLSAIWLVPLIALTIAGWLAYQNFANRGPLVTIMFNTAEGLEAGRTKVKFKDVEVGEVTRVQVTTDLQGVVVTAQMVRDLAPYMTEGTRFWVVKPRVGTSGVSGLDTLVSGAFIEIDPVEGEARSEFRGLEEPPLVRFDVPGRQFILEAEELSDITRGAPIYYQGLEIGQVLGYKLADDDERFEVPIFIEAPHDRLVRESSRFWILSAVRFEAGANGLGLEIGTLQSVFTGGISFDSPNFDNAEPASPNSRFTLYPDLSSVGEASFTQSLPFRAFFEGSVRGLRAGAPVEIRGMKVGEVREVGLEFNADTQSVEIPVTLDLQPQRLSGVPDELLDDEAAYQGFDVLVERGLRAQLKTGSLITGELYVDLVFEPNAKATTLDFSSDPPIIPTVPSDLDALAASLENLLNRVANLPLEALAQDLQVTVQALNARIDGEDVSRLVADIAGAASSVRNLADRIDDQSEPLIADLRRVLANTEQAAGAVQGLVGGDGELRFEAEALMRELTQAARSIRVFADYLERHPEALLRGKPGGFQ